VDSYSLHLRKIKWEVLHIGKTEEVRGGFAFQRKGQGSIVRFWPRDGHEVPTFQENT